MNTVFTRSITNELHSLESLMNGVTNFLEDQGVDAQAVYRINLAMEEMVTNVIKYAYSDYESHTIDISVEVKEEQIVALIEDTGRAFDPLQQEKAEAEGTLEASKVGGLGIHLIKQMLESLEYRREGRKNILEIRARRNAPAAS